MSFEGLGLAETLLRAVRAEGYTTPTKIQAAAIPAILEGRDVLGCAQTGTGKTAAFALPALAASGPESGARRAAADPRPGACAHAGTGRPDRREFSAPTAGTRACARRSSTAASVNIRRSAPCGPASIFWSLRPAACWTSCSNGTLISPASKCSSSTRPIACWTWASFTICGGSWPKVPTRRQTLLFSATMPPAIRQLAAQWLRNPVDVKVNPAAPAAETVRQSVMFVEQANKIRTLTHLLKTTAWTRTLVFTRTKRRADKVASLLRTSGIAADAFHADKSQAARQRSIARFKSPKPAVLVATDIAARGLDIDMVSHVINFDLPIEAENYVHRIGRTGRAGADGVALSFCDAGERDALHAIQRLTKQTLAIEGPGKVLANERSNHGLCRVRG